jgi:hypothetical protein
MRIKLFDICHGRSGDKGDTVNIGLIARKQEYYHIIQKYVTTKRVEDHFGSMVKGTIERFEMPNLWALNFLLHHALGGGGTKSLMNDAQGKTFAAGLLKMEIDVTEEIIL